MKVAALHLERIARGKKTRSWFKWYVEHLANLRAAATTVQARARGVAGRAAAQRARGEGGYGGGGVRAGAAARLRGGGGANSRRRGCRRRRGKSAATGGGARRGAGGAARRAAAAVGGVAPPRCEGAAADAWPDRAQVARPASVRRGQGRRVQGPAGERDAQKLLRSWGFAWAGGQRGVLRWLLAGHGAAALQRGTHADAPPPPPPTMALAGGARRRLRDQRAADRVRPRPPTDASIPRAGHTADVVGPGGRPAVALACMSGQPLVAALLVLYGAPVPTRDGAWAGENGGGGGASGRALAERVAELIPLAYKGGEIADFGEVLTLAMSSTAAHTTAPPRRRRHGGEGGGDHTKTSRS